MSPAPNVLRLSVGHFCVDGSASMLGSLIPFLFAAHGLSLTQTGLLAGLFIFSSAFLQPLFGYLSDRVDTKIFIALGPAIAGIFISSLGIAPNFPMMLGCVFLASLGTAAFHPQGTAMVSESSQGSRDSQLSFFITSGMLGFSVGPLAIVHLVGRIGLEWGIIAAIPGVLVSLYLLLCETSPRIVSSTYQRVQVWQQIRKQKRQLTLLFVLVVIRSGIQVSFTAMLPLFLVLRGYSEVAAGEILALFLLAGALACFLGGVLADVVGGRRVLIWSMSGLVPTMIAFLFMENTLSIVFCVLGGAFLLLSAPVNVAIAQRLVPQSKGTISALMMGLAWGIGGVSVPILGWASDTIGLTWGFLGIILLGVPGVLLSLALSVGRK